MALSRLKTETPITGTKFWRLTHCGLGGMDGSGHVVFTARAEQVLEVAGVQQVIKTMERSVTLYEEDVLGDDGQGGQQVVIPNNLATQVQIRDQATGSVLRTVTYEQIFQLMLSLAQHIRTSGN